ncbi:MAG: DUF1223 domain-containing protein, partial [Deltaproteobacteria bacterium]|nr:DUF1223 domain-containing protein [Deltaproteobacteria bacterium]
GVKLAVLILLLISAFSVVAQSAPAGPVVVELFTSEGCSSCPPADALLVKLSQESGIIVLGEHVDYWNYQGWTDRFSSHDFTLRQEQYVRRFGLNSAYTPQMVIDGTKQLVGNDPQDVSSAIKSAAAEPDPSEVSLSWEGRDHLHVVVHTTAAAAAQIMLAVTEDGLSTAVHDGENNGRTLRHAGVVRVLRPLGTTANGSFDAVIKAPHHSDWKTQDLRAIVFAQEPKQGRMLGAAAIRWQ